MGQCTCNGGACRATCRIPDGNEYVQISNPSYVSNNYVGEASSTYTSSNEGYASSKVYYN